VNVDGSSVEITQLKKIHGQFAIDPKVPRGDSSGQQMPELIGTRKAAALVTVCGAGDESESESE
jgi:hypothetical protein